MVLVIATIKSLAVLCAGFIDFITFVNYNHLAEAMNKKEEDSENLHQQLLDGEIELGAFVQRYKKLRSTYHNKALIQLAAKTTI